MNHAGITSEELRERIDNYFKNKNTNDNVNKKHEIGEIAVIEQNNVIYYLLAISMMNTSHLNKNTSNRGVSRHIGSMDITAATRSGLLVGTPKENKEVRAVAHVKSSLAPNGDNFTFILSKEDGFHWGEKTKLTEDEIVDDISHTSGKERAKEFLLDFLSDGPVLSEECYKKSEAAAITRRTLETAKSEINAKSKKEGTNWFWSIS